MLDSDQLSRVRTIITYLAVLILGSVFAAMWSAGSTKIENTGIWQLEPNYRGIYVQTVADAYAVDNDETLAIYRLSFICQAPYNATNPDTGEQVETNDLNAAFDTAISLVTGDPGKQARLDNLRQLVTSGQVVQNEQVTIICSTKPTNVPGFFGLLGPIGVILTALGIIGANLLGIIGESEEEAAVEAGTAASPAAAGTTAAKTTASSSGGIFGSRAKPQTTETAKSAAARGAQISATIEKTDFESKGVKPPIVQFMTTYLQGDDLYDDSFSIETSSGEFLGETGVGIAHSVDEEGKKRVAALEIWLFDKNDIRTVTKVLMSEHTFNDDAVRARLAAKGEAALAKANDKVILETATLRIQARIVDMAFTTAAPPNNFFDRITIELAAWKREDAGAAPAPKPPTGLPSL